MFFILIRYCYFILFFDGIIYNLYPLLLCVFHKPKHDFLLFFSERFMLNISNGAVSGCFRHILPDMIKNCGVILRMDIKGSYDNTPVKPKAANADWHGRKLILREETDIFPDDSYVRIFLNEQASDYSPHWHNALEIIMPVENYYDVEVEGKTYHLTPDQILFISSGATHALKAPGTGKRYIFLFGIGSLSKLRGFNSMHSLLSGSIRISSGETPEIFPQIHELLSSMAKEYFSGSEFYEFSVYSSLFRALVLISRHCLNIGGDDEFRRNGKKHFQRFQNALDYIELHYTENLKLEDVAEYCGFSKYYFSRLFKEYTNYNYYDYLVLRRIRSAEILLSDSALTITEAGFQSGFSSIATFNRSFKKVKGCTPGEYRLLYSPDGNNDRIYKDHR